MFLFGIPSMCFKDVNILIKEKEGRKKWSFHFKLIKYIKVSLNGSDRRQSMHHILNVENFLQKNDQANIIA